MDDSHLLGSFAPVRVDRRLDAATRQEESPVSDPDRNHPHAPPAGPHPLSGPDGGTDWAGVCVDLVGAQGAAIVATTASCPDTRRIPSSTCATATRVADLLYVLGIGPHTVSIFDGAPCAVAVDDVADRARWPVLVDELSALGVRWVQTYPIRVGNCVIGTVQLHHRTVPDPPVSNGIATLLTHLTGAIGADLISGLLDDPSVDGDVDMVNMAVGVLVARHCVTVETASALLRAGAYVRGHTSVCEAVRVVDSVGGPDPW